MKFLDTKEGFEEVAKGSDEENAFLGSPSNTHTRMTCDISQHSAATLIA